MWLGTILAQLNLPRATTVLYQGPLSFMPLHWWGTCFISCGVLSLIRIGFLNKRMISLAMHLPVMCIALTWSISFDLGPTTTGQPLYTFFAIVVAASPFISSIILFFAHQTGYAFVATPRAKWPDSDFRLSEDGADFSKIAFDATHKSTGVQK